MNPLRSLFLAFSRMPPAVMLLLIVGLAVVITMVVTGNLSAVQRQASEREAALKALYESKSKVVFATRDIPQGEPVTADAIEEKQELVSKIPVGAVTNTTAIVGRIAKFPIASGQIVSDHDLVGAALASGLESVLKPGFEAVTLAVDPDTGVAGFIRPGSHVDIYATAGSESKTKAGAILSDCNVVAVDKDYGEQAAEEKHNADKNQNQPNQGGPSGGGANGPSSNGGGIESTKHITLQLEPKSIQRLLKGVQAGGHNGGTSSSGKLYLTLRGFDDHTPIPIVDVASLFSKSGSATTLASAALRPPPMPMGMGMGGAPMPPPGPPMHQVEVWSADHKDVISVPQT